MGINVGECRGGLNMFLFKYSRMRQVNVVYFENIQLHTKETFKLLLYYYLSSSSIQSEDWFDSTSNYEDDFIVSESCIAHAQNVLS